jgi:xanthine dehydrogenase accessory factor
VRERCEIVQLGQQGEPSVMVTLVRVKGSSYRQSGARLLFCRGGKYASSISGGCLEAEILRKAPWLVRNGPVVKRYSTLFDDSAEVPFGLGCGGVIDLLFEPAGSSECQALLSALGSTLAGEERIVLTQLPAAGQRMARAVLDSEGNLLFVSEGCSDSAVRYAKECAVRDIEPLSEEFFVERLGVPQRLFLLGAGDDAKPLVNMAALMGYPE